MVQISKIVVGYNVCIEILLDLGTYNSITSKVDTALTRDAKASATLFGCRLNLGHCPFLSRRKESADLKLQLIAVT
jgi:hypothetical protein